jgi:hypothetical protein
MTERQTRRASFIEVCVNMAIGYAIATAAQLVIFPAFDIHVSIGEHLAIGLAFTVVSIVRSYALRRLFETLRLRGVMQ